MDGPSSCIISVKGGDDADACLIGGGYAVGAGPAHFRLLLDFVKLAAKNGLELRVMLLEYGEDYRESHYGSLVS